MGDLSKDFSRHEFACKCGCGFDTVDTELLKALQIIRGRLDSPITITSGCRCDEYNREVGGKENSQHKKGRAADIVVSGISPRAVAALVGTLVGVSCGRYDTFTHIDTRSGPSVSWD